MMATAEWCAITDVLAQPPTPHQAVAESSMGLTLRAGLVDDVIPGQVIAGQLLGPLQFGLVVGQPLDPVVHLAVCLISTDVAVAEGDMAIAVSCALAIASWLSAVARSPVS